MNFHAIAAGWRGVACAAALCCAMGALAEPLTNQEIIELCRDADDPQHCGKLIERTQLKRHADVATRSDRTLIIRLKRGSVLRFTDTDQGTLDYSLWDVFPGIGYVVVWVQKGETSHYMLINLQTGRGFEMAGEPVLAPDENTIASADFCPKGCANELALWQVQIDRLVKSRVYRATNGWVDAAVRWKNYKTLYVNVQSEAAGSNEKSRVERILELSLDDREWKNYEH